MKYQIRPRVSTSLDSRLWVSTLETALNTTIGYSVTNERPDVPIVTVEIDDSIPLKDVVVAADAHNLTVLEL